MGSGAHVVKVNNLERAVSTDINRLQAFAAQARSEVARFAYDSLTNDFTAGGVEVMGAQTVGNPLRGEVLCGVRVRPEIGTVNCFVEAGVVYLMAPDAMPNPDDSSYKEVIDPGVQLAGQLVLTPNASGMTRFDVVECQRDPDKVLETDNRDVFNTSTGLFTATSVTKATADRLLYRIRLGAPGGGFAGVGTASGWLPLAVARVPNGANTWDACDLWDVRPLISDRVRAPFQEAQVYPAYGKGMSWVSAPSAMVRTMGGVVESSIGARRAGGIVPAAQFDLASASVMEAGLALAFGQWFVYALFPFGLPRWCRYTDSGSGIRIPGGFRGIPVLSQKPPGGVLGAPNAAVSLPTGLELGGTSAVGVALHSGHVDNMNVFTGSVMAGGWTELKYPGAPALGVLFGGNSIDYNIVPGASCPRNASAVRLRVFATLSDMAGTALQVDRQLVGRDPTNMFDLWSKEQKGVQVVPAGGSFDIFEEFEVPLLFSGGAVLPTTLARYTITAGGGTMILFGNARVLGWRIGTGPHV